MKVLLIETGNAKEDPFAQCWYTPETRRFTVPLLALPLLASLMPREWDLKILDEKVHNIDTNEPCDMVCFSFKSKDAIRTYRYADEFRARGITVILGGVHASLLPEEAAEHADSVIAGEAEPIWEEVHRDLLTNSLKRIYRSPKGSTLETPLMPRFDLIDSDAYCMHAIQTSRGCLVGCDFCPVHKMHGGRSRNKSVERVMEEVEAVLAVDSNKPIFFVDEMFCGGNREYQRELLHAIRKRGISFVCISDFKVIDPEYIWDLARSGCLKISINMPGTCLPQELRAVRAIQSLGIDVWGFFMFGFSFHEANVFDKVISFVKQSGMRNLTLTVVSPFPNTPMASTAESRNAIISKNWELYDQCHVVMEPERMSSDTLENGFLQAWGALEERMQIHDSDFLPRNPLLQSAIRFSGLARLSIDRIGRKVLGIRDEPVDLEKLIGVKRAEVSITTHDTMGTR